MTQFLKNGNTYRAVDNATLDVHDLLPVGSYTIKMDPLENFYFEQVDSFVLPSKLYGNTTAQAERMINTFQDRPNATGVLLTGEKGSGKTLLAKTLAVQCAEQGIPTIIINTSWHGDKFNTLIQSIEQPCMILFDEFEKVYDDEEQEAILTLLDGVFPSKKLFVLTCNDKWRIDQHMRNRPGRIFYMLDFKGLDVTFVTQYCEDNLLNKGQIENVCRVGTMFAEFNFDMLKALVEEMNRYNETAQEAIKMLNAKPQSDDGGTYKVTLRIDGVLIPEDQVSPKEWRGNPLQREQFVISSGTDNDDEDDDEDSPVSNAVVRARARRALSANNEVGVDPGSETVGKHKFTYLHLKKVDPQAGSLSYVNDTGATVTFTKVVKNFVYEAF